MTSAPSTASPLSIRSIAACALVATLVFIWPTVGTIALRHLLLGALLVLLVSDRAVLAAIRGVLRSLSAPVVLLLLLTAWIVLHNATLSQYPSYSAEELRGQWLKPLLIFAIGMLLAAKVRTEPALLRALLAVTRWSLVLQILAVIGDLGYLWWRDVHLPHGTVRLTGTRTSISYSVLLLISIIATDWLRGFATTSHQRLQRDAAVVIVALACLVLIGSRYGIVLSLGLLAIVATVMAWRQLRMGSRRRAMMLIGLMGLTTAVAVAGAVRFDPRWERMVESAQLALAPGHEDDWRRFTDANPPRFDDGTRAESSAFLRVSRFRVGLSLVKERPLGWGFGRSAMEHIVSDRHGIPNVASDSGLLDWTLAIGIPGTALWLGFAGLMLAGAWQARDDAASAAPLLLFIVAAVFLVRFVLDINTRDHMLEMFLFYCGLLGGAAPRHRVPR